MKRIMLTVVLAASAALPAAAQFGSGVVFDPTQAGNVAKQLQQGVQAYNMSVQQYNQMKQMATAPQSAFTQYSNSGTQQWVRSVPRQTPMGTRSRSSTPPQSETARPPPTRSPAFPAPDKSPAPET